MDGIEAAFVMREKWGIPVVFLTAHADADRLERAKLTYPFGYLLKPFSERELEITLDMAMYVADVDAKRMEMEKALQEYKMVIENASEMLVVVDRDFRYKMVNQSFLNQRNARPDQIIGKSIDDVLGREAFEKSIKPHLIKSFQGETVEHEMEYMNPSGKRCLLARYFPLFDDLGQIHKVVNMITDITDRKLNEENLAGELSLMTTLLDNIPDCIALILKKNTREIVASNKFARNLGALPGYTCFEAFAMRDDRCPFCLAPELWETGNSQRIEVGYLGKWYEGIWEPLSEDLYVHYIFDITERKRVEMVLRDSEEKYRTLFENMELALRGADLGTWDWDVVTGRVVFNARWVEMLGYDPEEIEPHVNSWEKLVHPDDYPEVMEALDAHLDGRTDYYETEYRLRHKSGDWIWVLDKGKVIERDTGGLPLRACGTHLDVSARKQAEEALRNRDELYRATLDHMMEGCQIIGFDWRYLYVNDAVVRHGKQARERLLGRTMMEVYPGIEDTEIFACLRRCQEERIVEHLENEFRFPDGSTGWFALSIQPAPEGIFVLSIDITERKRTENALRESEEKYKLLVENANEVVLVAQDGRFKFVSQRASDFFGYKPEELKGYLFVDHVHPEDKGLVDELQHRILGGESSTGVHPFRMYDKTGKEKWVQNNAVGIDWEGGPATLNLLSDISERKQAEEALAASERKYRALFEGVSEGILVADAELRAFLYANPAICHMLGYTVDELLRLTVEDIHPQESLPHAIDIFEAHACEETIRASALPCLCKDGTVIQVDINAAAVTIDGRACVVGFFTDVTERKRLEAEKAELEEQLHQAQKMEAVGRLAGGVAHDFNNMLTVINGNAELALLTLKPDDPNHEIIQEIFKSGKRSADLTRQLLAFARRQAISPVVLDLNETVEGMLKMLRRLLGEDVDIVWKPCSNPWPVKMDPAQIDQIMANLCVNARDAISGVGKVTIETVNVAIDPGYSSTHIDSVPGKYVMLTISDNGMGMDKPALDNIFEPFFTTKKKGEGTGLGLATVYGIVKQNNGFINVYSEPGQGTTFKIYLPRPEGQTPEAESRTVSAPPKGRGEMILLVEDELTILNVGKHMLEKLGYTVLAAGKPGEAVRLCRETPGEIQLLITDVVMPEMNGRELAERLIEIKPDMKCLFMSGYTANVIAHHGVLEPGVQFIQKPFSLLDFAAKVRETLDG
ncbi:MAG: PAS domain S-box protein [Proteobacteria bacterium]|nr:PAS domain S-box protein [Pseudomonadota bacterium]